MEHTPHVAVVGAGISGLSGAYELVRSGCRVTVLEGSPRIGGKLSSATVAGVAFDDGAESVLVRRPEALDLIRELGLEDRLTHPGTTSARIYSRGALRPLPTRQVMGVPADPVALARSGLLSPGGVLRAARDLVWPASPPGGDVSVADHIGRRMGREVVDRLVEPLLGGVYAGRADELSLEATLPQIASLARTSRSLAVGVGRAAREARIRSGGGPVFATLRGGVAGLAAALADKCGAAVETSATVRGLRREGRQWRLTVGSAHDPREITADGVLLACPAAPAARLLGTEIPAAAEPLAGIEYAGMAVVTLAYPRAAVSGVFGGGASGVLVPAVEGRSVKAVTFSSVKWPWLAEELREIHSDPAPLLLRCSIGRVGEESLLQRDDADLMRLAARDLAEMCGITGPPLEGRVTRWGGALPQYTVGHLERVERVRAALGPHRGLGICGAALDGVGIAACVATARSAATELAAELSKGESPHSIDETGTFGRNR